ncbi:MAG: ArsC/Spx/MgsR family protein [Pseudomonadota bacterium]
MVKVIFYEKPGCIGNGRQKVLLSRAGHELDVRDMTAAPWTPQILRSFFGDRPLALWFNQSSPRLKSGEICPDKLDEREALALMCADPLLIRRPLLEVDGRREVGFEPAFIRDWIGLDVTDTDVGEGCPRPKSSGREAPA